MNENIKNTETENEVSDITPESLEEMVKTAAVEAEEEKRAMPKPALARLTYSAYSDMRPDNGSVYAPLGIWSYIGMLILFGIPVVGYISSIIYSFAAKKLARKRLAIAVFIIKTAVLLLVAAAAVTVTVLFGDRIMGVIRDIEQEFAYRS